ncbi:hypothetical protein BH23GEM8_BH23GEM8_01500 [soil metagenome]
MFAVPGTEPGIERAENRSVTMHLTFVEAQVLSGR